MWIPTNNLETGLNHSFIKSNQFIFFFHSVQLPQEQISTKIFEIILLLLQKPGRLMKNLNYFFSLKHCGVNQFWRRIFEKLYHPFQEFQSKVKNWLWSKTTIESLNFERLNHFWRNIWNWACWYLCFQTIFCHYPFSSRWWTASYCLPSIILDSIYAI